MGETLDVYVLNVDRERERISLSRKKLLPNPWTLVDNKYSVGELVEGKIIRIVDYGAFVEVEPGVEGLLHTSQISRGAVDSPAAMLAEGETHLLRIISIDADRQRMGLSLKAVTPTEQIEWMTQHEHEQVDADEEEGEVVEAEAAAEAPTDTSESDEAEVESERMELEVDTDVMETEEGGDATEESELPEAAKEVAVTTEVETEVE
jgi:ribosomal protein S1